MSLHAMRHRHRLTLCTPTGGLHVPPPRPRHIHSGSPMCHLLHGHGIVLAEIPSDGRLRYRGLLGLRRYPISPHRPIRPTLALYPTSHQYPYLSHHLLHMVSEILFCHSFKNNFHFIYFVSFAGLCPSPCDGSSLAENLRVRRPSWAS